MFALTKKIADSKHPENYYCYYLICFFDKGGFFFFFFYREIKAAGLASLYIVRDIVLGILHIIR